jgi:uncharacterized beta-barrel protein YwiB (DUF1934 family)
MTKIIIDNLIKFDGGSEAVFEEFTGEHYRKNGHGYLVYRNDADEKVAIKMNDTMLQMIRFSEPKQVMQFSLGETETSIMTPIGLQQFIVDTQHYNMFAKRVEIAYTMYHNDQKFADYELTIKWEDED